MRLQSGADEKLVEAVTLDPDFAVAHAALAMLGHEGGSSVDVAASLEAARQAVRARGDDRERSLVDVVGRRVEDVRNSGATALMNHIAQHPRDVLAVSAAVPTIAFSGVTDIQQEAWELVEGLAPAYGDHWWYISLLAFTRQDQSRFDDAGLLAESALECEPTSGHAVHAQTHVMYETGRHEAGRAWLDHWVAESGRSASHRAHFSWHAALHELAIGDTEAVRQRYYTQLAPPTVTGVRALIDSASLLWRWVVTTSGWDAAAGTSAFTGETAPPPVECVLEAAGPELVDRPETPFVALHAALALAAAGDLPRLAALRAHCQGTSELADPHDGGLGVRGPAGRGRAAVGRGRPAALRRPARAAARRRLGRAARDRRGDAAVLPGQRRPGRAGPGPARRPPRPAYLTARPAPPQLPRPGLRERAERRVPPFRSRGFRPDHRPAARVPRSRDRPGELVPRRGRPTRRETRWRSASPTPSRDAPTRRTLPPTSWCPV